MYRYIDTHVCEAAYNTGLRKVRKFDQLHVNIDNHFVHLKVL